MFIITFCNIDRAIYGRKYRMETFIEKPWTPFNDRRDRASRRWNAGIKLGHSVNEKTFQPENNSRIDTRSYHVDPIEGEGGKKKKKDRTLSRFLPLLLLPRSSFGNSKLLHQQPLVKSVKRDTASRGGQNKYGHGSSVTRDQRIFTLDERISHWRRKSGNIWWQTGTKTRMISRNGTKVEEEN